MTLTENDGECWEGTQVLMRCKNKSAGLLTGFAKTQRKAAQPEALGRLAGWAGMEVDDLAAQLFRRPLFFRRLKICRNVKFNQFRHHILLTGDPRRLTAFFRSHRTNPIYSSAFRLFHLSISYYSKLSAIYRNTEIHGELFADIREKTQVSLSRCALWRKINCIFQACPARMWTVAEQKWAQRTKVAQRRRIEP
jgi:hypothetical protein